ncbi:MAG TPA: transcriptional regulator [Firmicutes bacterium]|nr:transcriptional regulator [Clostridiales bacterium]HBN00181.1 transcriptional regulator [Bacillota bacterium]
MVSEIGMYLRRIRLENGEILKTMAEKLNVTSAFLSAVENGKKKAPMSWEQRISDLYNLSDDEKNNLAIALAKSSDVVEIDIKDAPSLNRDTAICFARQFASLDEETTKIIFNILNKKEN